MGAKDGDKNHILILSQKLFLSIVHKTLTVEKGCGSVCSLVVPDITQCNSIYSLWVERERGAVINIALIILSSQ
jgi:hypothetical protein